MGYSADSFTAGEQPTTAKWNKLWTNDASFNDGTGIGTNAIAAASLATSSIKLGYKTIAVQSTGTTTENLMSLSSGTDVQVTVPAGGRDVKISFNVSFTKTTADGTLTFRIKDGGTTGSANLRTFLETVVFTGGKRTCSGWVTVAAPAAGARTFALTYQTSNNGVSFEEGELRVEVV